MSSIENQADFSQDIHQIWTELYKKLWPQVEQYACQDYLDGAEILDLPKDCVPTVQFLNNAITPRTGWQVERTSVRYTDAVPWYKKFAQRIFLITNYMRSWDEIDWTPEPDMWHDVFGHLPFMVHKHYADLEDLFAPAFLAAKTDEQRDNIKRLAWYSTEFGLIREKGEIKLFGAGLISGSEELDNVIADTVPTRPFTIENVIKHDKAVWEHNQILFVIDSIDELTEELNRYFAPIMAQEEPVVNL